VISNKIMQEEAVWTAGGAASFGTVRGKLQTRVKNNSNVVTAASDGTYQVISNRI